MHARKVAFVAVLVLTSALVGSFLLVLTQPNRRPPAVQVLEVENAGVLDDHDLEMSYVTLRFTNTESAIGVPESTLCIRQGSKPFEVRVAGQWRITDTTMPDGIYPLGGSLTLFFVLPGRADACRICLTYTGSHSKLTKYIPHALAVRLPWAFWRWVGFPGSVPNSNWKETTLEVAVPTPRAVTE